MARNASPETSDDASEQMFEDSAFELRGVDVLKRGQVTISKDYWEDYGIGVGSYVDLRVRVAETVIRVPDARIGESGRVTIPSRQRDRYNIESNESEVDVAVFVD